MGAAGLVCHSCEGPCGACGPCGGGGARSAGPGRRRHKARVAGGPVEQPATRLALWVQASGAHACRRPGERSYWELVSQASRTEGLPQEVRNTIRSDVPRTFFFGRPRPRLEESQALERMLFALALWDPGLAYCQGMNFLACFALLAAGWGAPGCAQAEASGEVSGAVTALDEERAFWLVACLMRDYGARELFLDRTPLLKCYSFCFATLLKRQLPGLYSFLKGGMADVIGFKWFGTLMTTLLPLETAACAWDVLVRDGLDALLPLALGICSLVEPQLLAKAKAGVEPEEGFGKVEKRLPQEPALLLEGCEEGAEREVGARAAERLVRTAERFTCGPKELETLLDAWRRECPTEAADLNPDFSFLRPRAACRRKGAA